MTQAPTEPHHKDMAAKAAGFSSYDRKAIGYGSDHSTVKSILAHAQTLANLEAARADLAEIEKLTTRCSVVHLNCIVEKIAAIAAPYRASDPVAEALKAEAMTIVLAESVPRTIQQIEAIRNGIAGQGKIDLVMRALKRGMELARTIEGDR